MNGVENNGRSRGGCTRRGFLPGRSGNPGGRPKGLAALVRAQTNDGKALVELMVRVLHGTLVVNGKRPSFGDRIKAAEWLADCGWGKPVVMVESQADDLEQQVTLELARMLAQGKIVWAEPSEKVAS